MNNSQTIITAFIVTALWDVVLRFYAEDKLPHLPSPLDVHNWNWVKVLRPYFKKHTLLGAALIAGFVGAFTAYLMTFVNIKDTYNYAIVLTLLSGIVGIPMRYSGLFPHLKTYYYDKLDFQTSFLTDAFSGIIVALTMYIITYLQRLKMF
jgi:hypothetical protein